MEFKMNNVRLISLANCIIEVQKLIALNRYAENVCVAEIKTERKADEIIAVAELKIKRTHAIHIEHLVRGAVKSYGLDAKLNYGQSSDKNQLITYSIIIK